MSIGNRIKIIRGKTKQSDFAKKIGVSPRTLGYYENDHRMPDAEIVKHICAIGGRSANWLIYGDDEAPELSTPAKIDDAAYKTSELMRENRELKAENKRLVREINDLNGQILEFKADPERFFMVKMAGLAECSIQGWEILKDSPMAAPAPPDIYKEGKAFAILAIGDSMRPAGIENNFLVFCDPEREPVPGDIVYVEGTENHATIKLFSGVTTVGDDDFIALQGWLPQNAEKPEAPQTPFTLEVAEGQVKRMCTVVYIRR